MFGLPLPELAPPGEKLCAEVKNLFVSCADLSVRRLAVGEKKFPGELLWLDGCVDSAALSESVVRPLSRLEGRDAEACLRAALRGGLYAGSAERAGDPGEIAQRLCGGCAALFLFGAEGCVTAEIRSAAVRSVDSPTIEKSVLGAKDAFVETLRVNSSRLRRRIPSPALKLREFPLGRQAPTVAALFYIEGTADPELIRLLEKRLSLPDGPALRSPGELERLLAGEGGSAFPRVLHTERPDNFARGLLRGKVGVLCEGLPLGFLLPGCLPEMLSVGEDAARHAPVRRALVGLRALGLLLSLLLPALYTAAAMYHPEMIPYTLLRSLILAKESVPFSTAAEVLGMLLSFELLQEAGVRLPEPVGQTVSVIGALIVGQSAVEARVLSPIVIIVVALAGIGGYAQPSQELGAAVRLWRWLLVLLGATLGLFGVMAGLMELLRRLSAAESLGRAYLWPLCDR